MASAVTDKKPGLSSGSKLYLLAYNGVLSAGFVSLPPNGACTAFTRVNITHLGGF